MLDLVHSVKRGLNKVDSIEAHMDFADKCARQPAEVTTYIVILSYTRSDLIPSLRFHPRSRSSTP